MRVSDPIVPFRESVVAPPKVDQVNEEISQANKSLFAHHTQRLPAFMLKEIQSFSELIIKRDEISNDDKQVSIIVLMIAFWVFYKVRSVFLHSLLSCDWYRLVYIILYLNWYYWLLK